MELRKSALSLVKMFLGVCFEIMATVLMMAVVFGVSFLILGLFSRG